MLKNFLFNYIANPINLLAAITAPKHCEVCGILNEERKTELEFICNKCYFNLPLAPGPEFILNELQKNISGDELAIYKAFCLMSFKSVVGYDDIIHSFKYNGFTRIGQEFGKLLGRELLKAGFNSYNAIVPMPIHAARKRERGFNQADIIAKAVSLEINSPMNKNLVKRKKYTQTQTKLSSESRQSNVRNVFEVISQVKDHKILLIDDVLTTGSTLNSCAMALLEAGARQIDVAAIAKA